MKLLGRGTQMLTLRDTDPRSGVLLKAAVDIRADTVIWCNCAVNCTLMFQALFVISEDKPRYVIDALSSKRLPRPAVFRRFGWNHLPLSHISCVRNSSWACLELWTVYGDWWNGLWNVRQKCGVSDRMRWLVVSRVDHFTDHDSLSLSLSLLLYSRPSSQFLEFSFNPWVNTA